MMTKAQATLAILAAAAAAAPGCTQAALTAHAFGSAAASLVTANNEETITFASGSSCSLQNTELPWTLACSLELIVDLDKTNFANLSWKVTFDATIDAAALNDTATEIDVNFAASTPSIVFSGLTASLDVDAAVFPSAGKVFGFVIDQAELLNNVCVRGSLEGYASAQGDASVLTSARAMANIAGKAGVDVCAGAPLLKIDADAKTGEMKAVIKFSAFSEAKVDASAKTEMIAVRTLLGLSASLEYELNLGAMIFAEAAAGSGSRRRLEDNSVKQDGTITFSDNGSKNASSSTLVGLFSAVLLTLASAHY